MASSAYLGETLLFPPGPNRHAGQSAQIRAGTYSVQVGDDSMSGWHSHDRHQLEYAFEGTIELETATARYLVPPQHAVWIPAGVAHSSILTRVKAVSVFFDPAMGLPAGERVRVLAASPVIREMIIYAKRWPVDRLFTDPMVEAFFETLAYLVIEWLEYDTPLCLPTTRDKLISTVMDYTNAHLAEVTLPELCAAVGTSERTLRRAFPAVTGMPWRQYRVESRLLKAMALLAGDEQNVLAIAHAVGFQSVSAFTRAFRRYTGETPTGYRQRIRDGYVATAMAEAWSNELASHAFREWSHWDETATGSSAYVSRPARRGFEEVITT